MAPGPQSRREGGLEFILWYPPLSSNKETDPLLLPGRANEKVEDNLFKKASAYNAGDPGSIPGLGRSTGEGNGNPLRCSCLENPRDGGAWQAAVYGVAQSQT